MQNELKEILDQLYDERPLSAITVIVRASRIRWDCVSDDEIDICGDIILRITADLIILNNTDKMEIYDK